MSVVVWGYIITNTTQQTMKLNINGIRSQHEYDMLTFHYEDDFIVECEDIHEALERNNPSLKSVEDSSISYERSWYHGYYGRRRKCIQFLQRWLPSQVGRPVNDVYHDYLEKKISNKDVMRDAFWKMVDRNEIYRYYNYSSYHVRETWHGCKVDGGVLAFQKLRRYHDKSRKLSTYIEKTNIYAIDWSDREIETLVRGIKQLGSEFYSQIMALPREDGKTFISEKMYNKICGVLLFAFRSVPAISHYTQYKGYQEYEKGSVGYRKIKAEMAAKKRKDARDLKNKLREENETLIQTICERRMPKRYLDCVVPTKRDRKPRWGDIERAYRDGDYETAHRLEYQRACGWVW